MAEHLIYKDIAQRTGGYIYRRCRTRKNRKVHVYQAVYGGNGASKHCGRQHPREGKG